MKLEYFIDHSYPSTSRLNELGAKGWELCAIHSYNLTHLCIFKRQLEEKESDKNNRNLSNKDLS